MECTSIKFELFWRKISRKDGCKGVSENAQFALQAFFRHALALCLGYHHFMKKSVICQCTGRRIPSNRRFVNVQESESPISCDAHLTESNFQTRSRKNPIAASDFP